MEKMFDVIIIGGGIIGRSAALALEKRNFSVALIDAQEFKMETAGARVYAINSASQNLLRSLNVWEFIDPVKIAPFREMLVWDAQTREEIKFDAREIAESTLGYIVEDSLLKNSLLTKILDSNIQLFSNSKIIEIKKMVDSISVHTAEDSWSAQLLIIADGPLSKCRQLLNIETTNWSYHQQAIVCNVKTSIPHHQIAYQIFNSDGPLAFLPLPDPNQCSIVWSTSTANADKLIALPEQQFTDLLAETFQQKLGKLSLQSNRFKFPLVMRHVKKYGEQNWIIMGDAAHTIHPLAGLGLNLGFADLKSWLNCLDNAKNIWSHKTIKAYQRDRKNEVWQVIVLMDSLKMIFANPLLAAPRKLGLKLFNNLLPIKRFLIGQARGY